MTDELVCPECNEEFESTDDLEQTEVPELSVDETGDVRLHGNADLFLCRGCKKPMGVGRTKGDE